jgi:hypothetical protein
MNKALIFIPHLIQDAFEKKKNRQLLTPFNYSTHLTNHFFYKIDFFFSSLVLPKPMMMMMM